MHEYGYVIEEGVFLDGAGEVVPAQGPRPRRGFDLVWPGVSAESNLPQWDGLPVDYALCVEGVLA